MSKLKNIAKSQSRKAIRENYRKYLAEKNERFGRVKFSYAKAMKVPPPALMVEPSKIRWQFCTDEGEPAFASRLSRSR